MTSQYKQLINYNIEDLKVKLTVAKTLLNEDEYNILRKRLINLINNL